MKNVLIILGFILLLSCEKSEVGQWGYCVGCLGTVYDSVYFEPGDVYYTFIHEEATPFSKIEASQIRIVCIKDGYVKYRYKPYWGIYGIWSPGSGSINDIASRCYDYKTKRFLKKPLRN